MVAEQSENHLYSTLAQRLENLFVVVKDVLYLRVAEHIYFTCLLVIVDICGKKTYIIPEISSVFHPELERVQRIGVIHLEIQESLLFAGLPHCGSFAFTVLYKIYASVFRHFYVSA